MTLSPEQAWQSALGQLQMEMPKASFDTWVRDTRLVSYDDGLFTIGVRNEYARDWLESRLSEHRHTPADGNHEPDCGCLVCCRFAFHCR